MFDQVEIDEFSKRKLDLFLTKSVSAFWLACHAALPLFFRSDWLFHLWANFKDDIYIVTKNISPYSDIVDIVYAPFTNVVGADLYEFDNEIRDFLIFQLEQKFGSQYLEQLASFLYQYSEKVNLTDEDKNVHQITAWSIVSPHQAAIAIGNEFTKSIENDDKEEQNRLFFIMEAMTSSFETDAKKPFNQILNVAEINKDQNLGFESKSTFIYTESKPSANSIQIKIPIDLIPESNIKTIDNTIIERLNNILFEFDGISLTEIESSGIMTNDGTFPQSNYAIDEDGNITGLKINNINISKVINEIFKSIEDWRNLTELNLSSCGISDLSFLYSIQNLNELNLSDNRINDVTFISYLRKLTALTLSENKINDLSPLSALNELLSLKIAGNKIKGVKVIDIGEKTEFPQQSLETNINPLSELIHLTFLDLSNSNVSNISILESLINLEELILYGNRISDISSLKSLTNLKKLDLRFNNIRLVEEWICYMGMDFDLENKGFGIGLEGNPLQEDLSVISKKGKKALIEYFKNQRSEHKSDSEGFAENIDQSILVDDDQDDVQKSEKNNQIKLIYIDIHCHSILKPLAMSFKMKPGVNSSNRDQKSSIWYQEKPNLTSKLLNITTSIANFRQADFTSLLKGRVKIICVSLGGLEKGFVTTKMGTGTAGDYFANALVKTDKNWIDYLQKTDNYFDNLLMEYDFIKQLDGFKVKIDKKWYMYKIVSSFNAIIEMDESEENTIFVILTIEGSNVFNTGLQMMGKLASTEEVFSNVDKVKDWGNRVFFVTLARHFYNEMVGQAKSLFGIVAKTCDQTDGMNTGFTDLGWQLLRKLLDNSNGRRILIDLKHMSVKSRNEYYQFLEYEIPDEKIPLIVSHGAVNGFRSNNEKVEDDLNNYGKYQSDDINFYDDEILRIANSNGIFGIQFDLRWVASEIEIKKEGNSLNKNKMLFNYSKLIWNQIQHIAEILNQNNLFAWNIQSIGSNFDGMVNPLNGFWTAAELPILESYLTKHAYNFMNSPASDSFIELNKLSASEIVNRFMHDNAYSFISKNF